MIDEKFNKKIMITNVLIFVLVTIFTFGLYVFAWIAQIIGNLQLNDYIKVKENKITKFLIIYLVLIYA